MYFLLKVRFPKLTPWSAPIGRKKIKIPLLSIYYLDWQYWSHKNVIYLIMFGSTFVPGLFFGQIFGRFL